jgi:L-ascorbate metabolism protein UlaG (beta-lactamase superfamily)
VQLPILRRMGASTATQRQRAAASPNYRDGEFRSHEPTHVVATSEAEGPGSMLTTMVREFGRGRPRGTVPLVTPRHPHEPADLAVTWYGHATSVVELDGRRFLLDPVFGKRASPSVIAGPKRLHPTPGRIAEIPRLDAVVISHDHYDHLDEPSIRQLERTHRPHYVVPLGVDAHLLAWGVPVGRITSLDWREETEIAGIRVTCSEARHFSGRGFVRNQTLWAAWSLRGPRHAVFFGGDSGPTHRYVDIGADLGPFDLTIIPIGAYSVHWPDIHLNPAEAIEAHLDVNKGETDSVMLPIHWATFNLATHWWSEPIRWARRAAAERGVRLVAPRVGTRIQLSDNDLDEIVAAHQDPWWESCAAPEDHD